MLWLRQVGYLKKNLRIGLMSLTVKKFIEKKEQEFERDKELQKEILVEDNEGKLCCFTRESWVLTRKSDNPDHVFFLERLKVSKTDGGKYKTKLKEGDHVYRVGYFIIGKKGKPTTKITRMEDKLVWEGYSPLVLNEDFQKILGEAVKNRVIRPDFLIFSPL